MVVHITFDLIVCPQAAQPRALTKLANHYRERGGFNVRQIGSDFRDRMDDLVGDGVW